jgi:hypothetical protein
LQEFKERSQNPGFRRNWGRTRLSLLNTDYFSVAVVAYPLFLPTRIPNLTPPYCWILVPLLELLQLLELLELLLPSR